MMEEPLAIIVENIRDENSDIPRNSKENSGSNSSRDNQDRNEVLWEPRLDILCNKWRKDSIVRSENHDKKAKIHKQRFAVFSLPAIILPLVMSGLSNILVNYPLVSSSGMALTAILTGVNTFFNHSKKQTQHFEYSGRFFKLATDIETEMSKRKRDRIAADVFLERVSMDYNNLVFNSPAL
jgi:hypothetical protein